MVEMALLEAPQGGISKSRGVKLSAPTPKTWETTWGESAASFDKFVKKTGPFTPGNWETLAEIRLKNTGTGSGGIYFAFAELDKDGNLISSICSGGELEVPAGECVIVDNSGSDHKCTSSQNSACDSTGKLMDKKSSAGTYYYGVATFSAVDEKPVFPWPSPTAALAYPKKAGKAGGEKRITRRRRPARRPVKAGLSGNQKVAITGVCGAVAGGLIGYAVGRG